jgi:hypothetical protein
VEKSFSREATKGAKKTFKEKPLCKNLSHAKTHPARGCKNRELTEKTFSRKNLYHATPQGGAKTARREVREENLLRETLHV